MTATDPRPLAGLRVLEVSIAIAAPTCGKYLAYFGADVVKLESANNPDILRLFGSAWALGDEDLRSMFSDTSPYLGEFAGGKRSVGVDLKRPEGMEVARRLLGRADVFLTNYSAPAVRSLGLGPDDVQAINPNVIYAGLTGFGADAATPYYEFLAWGPNQAPLVGLDELTGYPDQAPAGIATISLPDYTNGLHGLVGVLVALRHRAATGEAAVMDLSQYEATTGLLGPQLMANARDGVTATRSGNRSAEGSPEGVYPCLGQDRWVAVSVTSDEAWSALCRAAGRDEPALLGDRWASAQSRRAGADELDALLARWTSRHTAAEVEEALQREGVAAHAVLDDEDLLRDRQVAERRPFHRAPSYRFGADLLTGVPVRLARTPGRFDRGAPCLFEHTTEVLSELCGYTAPEIDAMISAGVAFVPNQPERRLERPYRAWATAVLPHVMAEEDPLPEPPASAVPPPNAAGAPGGPGLAGVRVVDIAGPSCAWAGCLLAGFGADVVRPEPVDGAGVRTFGPFAGGHEDGGPEASLWHAYFGAGRRSIVIDDEATLGQLLAAADVVLHDGHCGLEPADAPGAVWVSVTPFGRSGPKQRWAGSNLTAWASSGVLYTSGFADHPPTPPGGPALLAYHLGALNAAIGALLALWVRDATGVAQVVDISLQDCTLAVACETGVPLFLDDLVHRARQGNRRPITRPWGLYPCLDGYVSVVVLQPAHWRAFAQWLHDDTGDDVVLEEVWVEMQTRAQVMDLVDAWVEALCATRTKAELFGEGQRRGIPITPVNTVADLNGDPHLAARRYFTEEDHPVLGPLRRPGAPLRLSCVPWALRRAPLLGEHSADVIAAWGLSGPPR